MWSRMTSFAKLVVIVLGMGAVGAGLYFTGIFKPGDNKKETKKETDADKVKKEARKEMSEERVAHARSFPGCSCPLPKNTHGRGGGYTAVTVPGARGA